MNVPRLDQSADAQRWIGEAHEDLDADKRLVADGPARVACFLSHLAVEKPIKAVLLSTNTPFRKVHDLFQLRSLLEPALNPWSIQGRYPGDLSEATDVMASDLMALAAAAGRRGGGAGRWRSW